MATNPDEFASTASTHARADIPPLPEVDAKSLAETVESHARTAPQASCLEYLGVSINYGELDRWANRFANLLKELGAKPGDVVGCHLPNTPQYVIALVAASKLGCPASGVSPLLAAPELKYQVEDAGIAFLVTLDSP
jgi:long-chain acyl-CoA synthetase